jgi:L-threonylcarbamoyladenylate synthase
MRVSTHPVVVALCKAFGGVLVSTSANPAGAPPPREAADIDPRLLAAIDGCVPGDTGGLARPTPIRDARSGAAIRA